MEEQIEKIEHTNDDIIIYLKEGRKYRWINEKKVNEVIEDYYPDKNHTHLEYVEELKEKLGLE